MNEGLQRKGFDVVAAASVAEALRSIITESFDALHPPVGLREPPPRSA
jgi:hypothetical protein